MPCLTIERKQADEILRETARATSEFLEKLTQAQQVPLWDRSLHPSFETTTVGKPYTFEG